MTLKSYFCEWNGVVNNQNVIRAWAQSAPLDLSEAKQFILDDDITKQINLGFELKNLKLVDLNSLPHIDEILKNDIRTN